MTTIPEPPLPLTVVGPFAAPSVKCEHPPPPPPVYCPALPPEYPCPVLVEPTGDACCPFDPALIPEAPPTPWF